MLVRSSDWTRPTDAAFAFRLRAAGRGTPGAFLPAVPPPGAHSDIHAVAREVMEEGESERFAERVQRWGGPEDVVGEAGERPFCAHQHTFEEGGWPERLGPGHVDGVMRGRVLALRAPSGQTDYVLRDHHMLDVALYHYRTTGALPRALFHADRHSDWCRDGHLLARPPQQAATWWALLEGLKRPGGRGPVLRERDVFFTTAQATREAWMSGREVGASTLIPGSADPASLGWAQALEVPGALEADWVSVDLDYLQPSPQLALTGGLLRDARFQALLSAARVRTFVLSPQFTNGGDKVEPWEVQGSLSSSLRLLNLLRGLPGRVRARGEGPLLRAPSLSAPARARPPARRARCRGG